MLRAGARDNRDRVLESARGLFAERGFDVTMREIARHAGVGPATLYRRFLTKKILVDEAFAEELRACRGIVIDGCADPDPWRGFCSVVERISVLNGRNYGFVEAVLSASPAEETFRSHQNAFLQMLSDLATRAQAVGGLRPDFVIDDLVLMLLTGRALSTKPEAGRTVAARRFAALAMDAFRVSDAHQALPRHARTQVAP